MLESLPTKSSRVPRAGMDRPFLFKVPSGPRAHICIQDFLSARRTPIPVGIPRDENSAYTQRGKVFFSPQTSSPSPLSTAPDSRFQRGLVTEWDVHGPCCQRAHRPVGQTRKQARAWPVGGKRAGRAGGSGRDPGRDLKHRPLLSCHSGGLHSTVNSEPRNEGRIRGARYRALIGALDRTLLPGADHDQRDLLTPRSLGPSRQPCKGRALVRIGKTRKPVPKSF